MPWFTNFVIKKTGNACGFSSCDGSSPTSPWLFWRTSVETDYNSISAISNYDVVTNIITFVKPINSTLPAIGIMSARAQYQGGGGTIIIPTPGPSTKINSLEKVWNGGCYNYYANYGSTVAAIEWNNKIYTLCSGGATIEAITYH